jgi:hypothetical protein
MLVLMMVLLLLLVGLAAAQAPVGAHHRCSRLRGPSPAQLRTNVFYEFYSSYFFSNCLRLHKLFSFQADREACGGRGGQQFLV